MARVQENFPSNQKHFSVLIYKTLFYYLATLWQLSAEFSRRNLLTYNGRTDDKFLSANWKTAFSVFTKSHRASK